MNPESQAGPKDLIQHLDSAVIEVFDVMLGTACSPLDPGSDLIPTITASIRLFGTSEVECLLCGTDLTARVMAEAFIGSLGDDSEALIADSFGELCNMVAGNWKNKLGPEHSSCSLTPPAISRFDIRHRLSLNGEALTRFYRFEEHVFGIVLSSPRKEPLPPDADAMILQRRTPSHIFA